MHRHSRSYPSSPISPIPPSPSSSQPTTLQTLPSHSMSPVFYGHHGHHGHNHTLLVDPHAHRPYTAPNSPLFHPSSPPQHHLHHHPHHTMDPFTPPAPPSTSSPSCSHPHQPAQKSNAFSRPKPTKKMSSSTTKHKSVQVSLEVKVERSKGFQAFFVPLARNLPPAPPSSPVLAHRQCESVAGDDYFTGWEKDKSGQREQWVEDIGGDTGMEVDSQ